MSIVISRDATPSLAALPRTLILASAGSGKTFRISSGIIGLLARGHAADEIFASTFTRKAAGEILERVLLRLAAAALDAREAAELAAHAELIDAPDTALANAAGYTPLFWASLLEQLARSLHRVNIGTLDAFFLRTAASFGQELGFPTRWSIADDTTSAHIRSLALQDVLATTDDAVLIELVRGIMRRPGTRSIHEQLLRQVKLLAGFHYALEPGRDDHWTGFDAIANGPAIDFRAERDALVDRIQALPVPLTKAGAPNKIWRNALSKVADWLRIGDWAEFTDEGLVKASRSGEAFSRLPVDDSIRAAIDAAWELGRAEVARDFAARSHALRRFAELYTAALDRRRRDLGAYEFDDITRSLGGPDPLGARPDMYFRLDARARHILLDEFQDTSAPQWEALAPLADELMAGHEHERSAVIVADPKQSIYGWRGGAPDLVDRLRRDYSLSDDALTKSWRSSKVVLDFVNDLYARVGDEDVWGEERYVDVARDWLRAFEPHSPAKDLAGYVRVEVGPPDEDGGEARPRLCRFAAEKVADLHARMPGFTIGVLTRTNATVARMMMNLKQLGVHASEDPGGRARRH